MQIGPVPQVDNAFQKRTIHPHFINENGNPDAKVYKKVNFSKYHHIFVYFTPYTIGACIKIIGDAHAMRPLSIDADL